MNRALALAAMPLLAASVALAQEFQPPRTGDRGGGTRLGIFGFGVHAGMDVTDPRQVVAGATLDLGNLFTGRLRLRAGGEIGLDGEDTFLGTGELLFRFTDDAEPAVPYVGAGLGVAGHDNCGADPDCPGLWVNLVVGFERRFRSTFNWRIEYRGLDALGRHRFSLGLVTRRGG